MIINEVKPQIIALCETKLASGQTIKNALPDYEICQRSTKAGQKGMAICVRRNTFKSILDVTSSTIDDIIVVRIEMATDTVRVILGYAPQENDKTETREEFFTELEMEIAKSKMADELPLVVGDMNAKISMNNNTLEPITANGKLLIELIKNQELDVLNYHDKCVGKWTHVIRTTNSPSVLDYILSPERISTSVQELIIDEDCLLCPFSTQKSGVKKFSDHNAILLRLNIPYQKPESTSAAKAWRITDDGIQKLIEITNKEFKWDSQGTDTQELYDNFEKELYGLMDECFQIRKPKKTKDIPTEFFEIYKKVAEFGRGGKAQRKVAKEYIKEMRRINSEKAADSQRRRIQTTVENLTVNNTFCPNNFWNLCKKARTKNCMGTSIETENGHEIFGEEMVRNAYMQEFQHRLRKREISSDLTNYEKQTEQLCQLLLQDKNEKDPAYTRDELEKVRKHLKKGKSSGRDNLPPEVFINGGTKLQEAMLKLFNHIKEENQIPKQWTQVQVTTMYKNKGNRKKLVNQRGIFLKQVLSKMYGKMNMNRAKISMKRINKCQAGGQENRSTADQTFLVRAAIDHCKYMNKPLFLTLYDYSQCFDSLWLTDCLVSMMDIGVEKEIVSILKTLNETCNIVVKTPAGMTQEFKMNSIVQQGSVSGGALCVASTAEICLEELGKGYQIGTAILKALAFVDDIATLNKNHQDTYQSHERVKWFSDKKRLLLNALKCLLLCINLKTSDVVPRLTIGDTPLKVVELAQYLGDIFNATGTNEDLVEDRVKKGKACTICAMSLCAEVTMGIYLIQTLLLLYRSVFLQVVLYNSQAWSNLTSNDVNNLQVVQLKYLKRMLHAPSSTPNTITFLETGTLPIKNEIHVKQLVFLYHILTLETEDPVRKTYEQQLMLPYENNWANNVRILREKYGILESDEQIRDTTKQKWKNNIKSKVKIQVVAELKESAHQLKYGKLLTFPENLDTQTYLTQLPTINARKIFHARSGTINLKSYRKYMYGEDTTCRLCKQMPEDIEHVINHCPMISRTDPVEFPSNDCDQLMEASVRLIMFEKKIEDLEKLSAEVNDDGTCQKDVMFSNSK